MVGDFSKEMKAFKTKTDILNQISDRLLKEFPQYVFEDVNFNGKFLLAEKCISMLVDEMSNDILTRYQKCNHCHNKEDEQ